VSLSIPNALIKISLAAGIALISIACAEIDSGSDEGEPTDTDQEATVLFVIDGDTVELEIDGEKENVRLIGIDAPESRARTRPVQCYGKESSDFLTELLPQGTEVRIERDIEARDQYDRLLLYIYLDDLFINEEIVAEGFANAQSYKPNTTKQDILFKALDEAKKETKGLWADCDGPDQPL